MGRTEPSVGRQPAGVRRDIRSKRAKATANKTIPMVLAAHPRARRGVEASELILDPPPASRPKAAQQGRAHKNEDHNDQKNGEEIPSSKNPIISLRVADTLEAAYSLLLIGTPSSEQRRDLSNTAARVGVLNMASPLSPGGGFFNGAQGQEEASLCARTTLLPALRDEFYRLPELGVVYTPDVVVFRDVNWGGNTSTKKKKRRTSLDEEDNENEAGEDEERGVGGKEEEAPVLPKTERWFVDVVSAAMLRLPEIDVDEGTGWASYANAKDRELAVSKMRAVMRVFAAKGVKRVVLGAWGCGAYANPVGEIARAWRKVLLGGDKEGGKNDQEKGKGKKSKNVKDSWENIEQIVFAIKDAGMARAFAAAFGEELVGFEEEGSDISGDEGDGIEDAKVKELRDKIQELELRIGQARTPQLRAGLDAVLAGLRTQLPDQGASYAEKDHDSEDADQSSESEDGEDNERSNREESDEAEDRNGHDNER
ncbi:uncharacterized protein F4822DRAFT_50486 [Hypoxylon trugodes]|uniref:uncharacterized protein n=1 Tax=Hypoxylon trugodes TaxID=326681 RepID=UPI00219FF0BE|nr:uncharacterized protein F4822DRAFT_50486 [Hypoxylon trugodes]KAI1383766.1 hypothetical protein F4822DRAFT_50486 [Hypoxylon trugodes]